MLPERGKRPGWFTLATNGAGGFWFDVMSDFPESVATSAEALEALAEAIDESDPLHAPLAKEIARVESIRDGVAEALKGPGPRDAQKGQRTRKRRRIRK